MKYLHPDYYEKFKCIAGDCPKTCCAGWQIEIDEDSLRKYESMGLKSVDYENELFVYDEKKRCVNLREDGLCQLIMEHGDGILCRTCATFPRHIEEFENVREYSLSISCPEVARIILSTKDKVNFNKSSDDKADTEDYDLQEQEVFKYLYVLRGEFLKIAQDRGRSFESRISHILSIAEAFQSELDFIMLEEDGALENLDMDSILNAPMSDADLSDAMRHTIFNVMKEWEFTEDEFKEILKFTEEKIYQGTSSPENELLANSMKDHLASKGIDLDIIYEQILVYFIYAYFCGSAYDEFYFGQAQLAVSTCLHIRDLALAHYTNNGDINLDDIIRYTYLYARELEHSIPNILATEAYMDENPLV